MYIKNLKQKKIYKEGFYKSFGPIVVTSAYVTKDDVAYLDELGVMDSKKITDDKIMKIAPLIAKRVKYKSLILNNSDYNKFHSTKFICFRYKCCKFSSYFWI